MVHVYISFLLKGLNNDVKSSIRLFSLLKGKNKVKREFLSRTKVEIFASRRRRHRLKGIHSRSDTNRTGDEGLSFYYPRLLHCLNQMLAVVLLNQH